MLETEVDLQGERGLHPVLQRGARQRGQFDRFERHACLRLVFGPRQRQQLIHQPGSRLRTFGQLDQRTVDFVRVALAQCQFRLHPHAGQRRLHLVGGIGDEAFLHLDGVRQAPQHVVEGANQRRNFFRHLARIDRRQIVRPAPADALLQLGQRRQPARQRKPHQRQHDRQDDELRQDHALDDLVGQLGALVERLRHLHQRVARRVAARRQRAQVDIQIGDPHRGAAHAVVAKAHARAARALALLFVRRRQVAVAVDVFGARPADLEIDMVDVVGAQDFARAAGQARHHLAVDVDHLLHQHGDAVFERMVERLVGDRFRHQIRDRDAHWPQQQQRRQHPVEDLAEQRVLDVFVRLRIGRLVELARAVKRGVGQRQWRVARFHVDAWPASGAIRAVSAKRSRQ